MGGESVSDASGQAGHDERVGAAELLPRVYAELRRLAKHRMAKLPPGQTLQATALVHEAYLRLVGDKDDGWDNRGHFFGAAARAMRDILVDRARKHGRIKHGGGRGRLSLDQATVGADEENQVEVVALDAALTRLAGIDQRKCDVVMLRYFAGLSIEETARAMDLSDRTVKREWTFAKSWLYDALAESES